MSDENRTRKNDGDQTSDRLEKDDDYKFIKETIKDKPLNKRVLFTKIAGFIGAGILFGAAAAVTFAGVFPAAENYLKQEEEPPKVNIPRDEPEVTATPAPVTDPPTPTPAPATPIPETPSSVPEETREKLGLKDYENIYQEVLTISEEPRKALVTVSGLSEQETVLDSTYLNSGQSVGIIIVDNGSDLYVLTEKQATDDAAKIRVTLADGSIVDGRLQKSDGRTGLAVVLVAKEQLKKETQESISVAVLGNSYSLIQGKPVIAIGSPSGYHDSVSYGTITSVGNRVAVTDAEYNLLTTDILGSSKGSGVLLDLNGEVIGIIAQSYGTQDDDTKNMVKGLAVSQLKPLIEILSNGEDIRYLGVKGQDVTEAISQSTGIPQGVYVDGVEEDSPAMRSGIQSGDVIVKMNDEEVTTMQKYSSRLQKFRNGQKVRLTVMRSKGAEGYSALEIQLIIKVN
ncbi:MAG: S1C family serine protease [Blautia sp.]|jgi:serine protease Do